MDSSPDEMMTHPEPPVDPGRPFSEFRTEGLLWLVNAAVFHPRGYALAFHWDDGADPDRDEPTGWSLLGDGSEWWTFSRDPEMDALVDDAFRRANDILRSASPLERQARTIEDLGDA